MRKKNFSRTLLLQKLRSKMQASAARRTRFNLKSRAERARLKRRAARRLLRVAVTYRRAMRRVGFKGILPARLRAFVKAYKLKKMRSKYSRAVLVKFRSRTAGSKAKLRVGFTKTKFKTNGFSLLKSKPRLLKGHQLQLFLKQQVLKNQKARLKRYHKEQKYVKRRRVWWTNHAGRVKLRHRGSPIDWKRYYRWVARRKQRWANLRQRKRKPKTLKYIGYAKWRLSRHGRKVAGRKTTANWIRRKHLAPYWWKRAKFYARWLPQCIPRYGFSSHPHTFLSWYKFFYSSSKIRKIRRLNFRPYVLSARSVKRLGEILYKRYRHMLHNAKYSSIVRVSDFTFLRFMRCKEGLYSFYNSVLIRRVYIPRFVKDKWPFVSPAAARKYAYLTTIKFAFNNKLRIKLLQHLISRWRIERFRFWMSKLWLRYYSWPHSSLFLNRRFKLRFRRFKYYTRLKKRKLFKNKVVPIFYVLNFLLSKTNLFITLTDLHGRVLFLETAGRLGFAGRQKRSSDAAIQMIKVVYKKFIGMLTEQDTTNKANFFEHQPAHERICVLPWHHNRRLPSLKWRLIVKWKGGFLHKAKRYYGFFNKLWERTKAKRYYLGCARSQRRRPLYIFPQLTRQGSFSYPIRRRKKNKGRNRRVKEILLARGRRKKGGYSTDIKISTRLRVQRRRAHRATILRRYWLYVYRRAFYLRKSLAGLGRRVSQAYALYYVINRYPFVRSAIYKRRTGRWTPQYPKKKWDQWAGSWQSVYSRHQIPILHYAETTKYTAPYWN